MSRLPRRRWWVAGVAIVAVAGLAAIPAAGRTVQLTPIKIAMVRLEPFAQAMYAKHRAMFRKQGIDAELQFLSDGTQVVPTLLSGGADFAGISLPSAARLKSEDAPVKVVAAAVLYDPTKADAVIVAAPGRTLRRARDLIGKTLAVGSRGSPGELAALEWLEKNGVDTDAVKIIYIPFPEVPAALKGGNIDAAVVAEPFLTLALEQGAKQFAKHLDAVCPKTCQVGLWLARAGVNPNLVARFRNAVQNAAVWANQDKNDAVSGRILAKYAPIDAKVVAKMRRATFGTRLRVSLAKPWLDLLKRRGDIPASFRPIDLVK
jgi:NitT/TauT family transport system substrate-binding protein